MNLFSLSVPVALRLPSWPLALLLTLVLAGCAEKPASVTTPDTTARTDSAAAKAAPRPTAPQLIDRNATAKTRALYRNLAELGREKVLFGHQDSLAYGVTWVDEPGRSDVMAVTGAYPAVYGWELGDLELGASANLDGVDFGKMQGWIREGYQRGGVVTLSWHMNNPATGGNAWDREPSVHQLLPGGEKHSVLRQYLDTLAAFNEGLTATDEQGAEHAIPVIFRPWHEHNGDWFWWGRGHAEEADFIALWRFTVEYLRDEKGVHNFIYAFSPDRSRIDIDHFRRDFLYGYPGDEYVDIMGLDNYWDLGHAHNPAAPAQALAHFRRSLEYTVALAREKGKIPALTEGGVENIPNPDFWTDVFLAGLNHSEETRQIAYALVWRNANREKENRDHYFAPYPGQVSADSFIEFYRHPLTLFGDGLPDLYRLP